MLVSAKLDNGQTDFANSFLLCWLLSGEGSNGRKKIRKLRGKLQNFNKLNDSLIFTGLTVTLQTGQRLSGQLVVYKNYLKISF